MTEEQRRIQRQMRQQKRQIEWQNWNSFQ